MSEKYTELPSEDDGGDDFCREVSVLTDQVRMLALNLAVNLARSKKEARELTILEPEFTKLVNGSVDVVREVATILKAFQNEEKMIYSADASGKNLDRIESSLNEILDLSRQVLTSIAEIKKRKEQLNKYNQ